MAVAKTGVTGIFGKACLSYSIFAATVTDTTGTSLILFRRQRSIARSGAQIPQVERKMYYQRIGVALIALAACTCKLAFAQDFNPYLSPGQYSAAGTTSPYTTPFDHDLEFFTPFEINDFGSDSPQRTGWFFTYDRLYWNVSAPTVTTKGDGDFGWGNRFNVGYFTPERQGWMFEAIEMSGPNVANNSSEMAGITFERMWRMDPLENGSILTPNISIRYMSIIDRTVPFDTTALAQGTAAPTKNNIIGGQAGLGWHMQRGHWLISTNAKVFVAENFQVFEFGVAQPGATSREFVPAGELRFDSSYYLTRDLALNFGWEMIYLGSGIARAGQLQSNDERMIYTGALFGFVFNK